MTLKDYEIIIITLFLFCCVNKLVMKNWIKGFVDLLPIRDFFITKNQADWLQFLLLTILSFLIGYQLDISIIKLQLWMRNTVFFMAAIITWKGITMDYDIVAKKNAKERILLIILTISLYFYPILILPYLFVSIHFFNAWLIHNMMPIRILKMFVSYLGALVVIKHLTWVEKIESADTFVPFILLMLCVQASHYFIPGVGKLKLGDKWNSWILENETHYLMISAYNWGWLQFLPERMAVNAVNTIKNFNQLINSCTVILQCGLFALMANSYICLLLLTGCTLLNIGIFLTTGLCFWEYALTNTIIIVLISNLSDSISTTLFSPLNWLVYLVILSLPLNGKVWTPYSMSWWDTPFIGKVHWRVVGRSGKIYELYNNFMCPYEELYGHEYGWFLVDRKIIYENHLGIWKYSKEVRDKIIASKGDLQILSNLQNQFGKSYRDFEKEREHEGFLIKFFTKLNSGFKKNVLPSWLKWLKAPGGYFFYWGEYPAYSRQEPVSMVLIYYIEKFFDGYKVKTVVNEIVKMVEIPSPEDITT